MRFSGVPSLQAESDGYPGSPMQWSDIDFEPFYLTFHGGASGQKARYPLGFSPGRRPTSGMSVSTRDRSLVDPIPFIMQSGMRSYGG